MAAGSGEGSHTGHVPNMSPSNRAQKNTFFFNEKQKASGQKLKLWRLTIRVPTTLAAWPQTIYLTSYGPFPLLEKAEPCESPVKTRDNVEST